MLQQYTPDDYVSTTGQLYTVLEFAKTVFCHLGLDWHQYVDIDPYYFSQTDINSSLFNTTTSRAKLLWQLSIAFSELVRIITEHALELAEREAYS